MQLIKTDDYLLLVDKDKEVKENDLFYHTLTSEINQAIHCNGKKTHPYPFIIAYYPLTPQAKSLELPLLPNPFRNGEAELLAEKFASEGGWQCPVSFIEGYKAAQHLNKWIPVSEQEPPSGVEVLAKSPEGLIHLINWRPAYKIFACQNKEESTYGWSWKTVE